MTDPCHGCTGAECASCWRPEIDRLIADETRYAQQAEPNHRRGPSPGFRERRRERLTQYAEQMRAGLTPCSAKGRG